MAVLEQKLILLVEISPIRAFREMQPLIINDICPNISNIARTEIVTLPKSELPPDAVLKVYNELH